jgi:hypothetical protein
MKEFDYIHEFIQSFAAISEGNNKAYWEWQLRVAENVIMQDWHNIGGNLGLLHDIKDALQWYPPEVKGCYLAAYNQSINTGADYVEGYMHSYIPMSHAWNAFGDFHYDTMTVLPNFENIEPARVQIIRLTPDELEEMRAHDLVGDMVVRYYIENVMKEKA